MISREESVYLDLVRFAAAILVVVTHLIQYSLLPGYLQRLVPDLGREAVVVFFVLSGYLIAYTANDRYTSMRSYLSARATRLYSVALPVLLLAFVVDSVGIHMLNGNYDHVYQYEKFYLYIPLHLAFLGEVWTLAERPFTADPYWSLSFEAWYYVWFATLFYFCGWRRIFWFLCIALIVGYQHWILFPIWLAGVLLYRFRDRWPLSITLARVGMALSVFTVLLLEYTGLDIRLWQAGRDVWPFSSWPQGSTDQFLLDYMVCACAVVNLYCARYAKLSLPLTFNRLIPILAGYTFTLYLSHTIVMSTWKNNFEYNRENPLHVTCLIALIVLATFTIGQLTEKRRNHFKPFIDKILAAMIQFLLLCPGSRFLKPNRL
ncbi:MAG: acyltransferase [Pseudomonadota bacterium]